MKRIPLKSRYGCLRCKERRKKCDETKPVCGGCKRLCFMCRWGAPETASNRSTDRARESVVEVVEDRTLVIRDASRASLEKVDEGAKAPKEPSLVFDSPSVLRTDAVPNDGSFDCKRILQYLSDRGTLIMRSPAAGQSAGRGVNFFRAGFPMASQRPLQLQAVLCLGAGHLSKLVPAYEHVALRQYNKVVSRFREELMLKSNEPPAEWMCAVASILSFYEVRPCPVLMPIHVQELTLFLQKKIAFHSPESRLAHLTGYHRLVELRLEHKLSWAPLKVLLEQYIHSLAIGSLYHHKLLVGEKTIGYVDELIGVLNDGPRPFGNEVFGVPAELTAVAYRLAILNAHDVKQAPWDAEFVATASILRNWTPALHTLQPSATGLLLVAKLYQLACICLLQLIADRTSTATNKIISACLYEACTLLQAFPPQLRTFNSLAWPLTVLSVFACDPWQQLSLKQPILALIETAGIGAYRTILSFLFMIEAESLGPDVFQRPDLLSMVHM